MPTVSLTLEEVDQSIVRQSILGIVKNLLSVTKLDSKVSIVLHGDIKYARTDNKFNAVKSTDSNVPNVASDRKVMVTIAEEYDEDALYTTAVGQREYQPIFLDPISGLTIWPVYIDTNYVISFSYITPSKTESVRWRDDMRSKLSQFRDVMIHEITYEIILPEVVEDIISDVYDLRNRLLPQSLAGYFRDNGSKRIKVITDMSGGNAKLALRETQSRILGMFDFTGGPEKAERDDDSNTYKISFDYKVKINKPAMMTMSYKPMVCNKLLPNKYFSFLVDKELSDKEEKNKDRLMSRSMTSLSHFEAHRQLDQLYDIKMPVNIPSFDIIKDRSLTSGYCVLTTMLTQVDETDKKSLFSLKELEPYYLDRDFMEWVVDGEYAYIGQSFQSVLFFGLCQDDKYFNNPVLTVDSNLNVASSITLDLMTTTRVYMNFIIDLTTVNEKVFDRMLLRPSLFITFILEWLLQIKNYPEIYGLCDKDALLSFLTRLIIRAGLLFSFEDFLRLIRLMGLNSPAFLRKVLAAMNYIDSNSVDYFLRSGRLTKDMFDAYTGSTSAPYAKQGLMKTVQTSYIIATTKEELDGHH